MSVEFFGVGGPSQIGNLKKSEKTSSESKSISSGEDTVQFSSVLQEVNKAQAATPSANTERANKVQELKTQIQEGSYEPDLQKVSSSLLQFLVEGR
ncbi:MAG: flagellar biosynthesis anti-sigma factor FlgM [Desulfotalea sp.]|nr:MAG: flagellar biosynthesis anti-sigma factor FlgM [Desulfotalea sp.]